MSNFIREYLERIDQLQMDIADNETFIEDKARHTMILHVLKKLATVYGMLESCLPEYSIVPFKEESKCHLLNPTPLEEKLDVRKPSLNGGGEKPGQNGSNLELSSHPAGSGHSSLNNAPVTFLEAPRGLLKWVEDRIHVRKT